MDTYYDYTNARCLPILVYLNDEEWEQAKQLMDDRAMLSIHVERQRLAYEEENDNSPNVEMTCNFFRWLFKLLPPDSKMHVKVSKEPDDGIYISKKEIIDEVFKRFRKNGKDACEGLRN